MPHAASPLAHLIRFLRAPGAAVGRVGLRAPRRAGATLEGCGGNARSVGRGDIGVAAIPLQRASRDAQQLPRLAAFPPERALQGRGGGPCGQQHRRQRHRIHIGMHGLILGGLHNPRRQRGREGARRLQQVAASDAPVAVRVQSADRGRDDGGLPEPPAVNGCCKPSRVVDGPRFELPDEVLVRPTDAVNLFPLKRRRAGECGGQCLRLLVRQMPGGGGHRDLRHEGHGRKGPAAASKNDVRTAPGLVRGLRGLQPLMPQRLVRRRAILEVVGQQRSHEPNCAL
mmetsp:Transcript_11418/g.32673  ORF Transcript_11418/g.32673 Transcript_11418/m.32673 type:complete len:284 (+) Transcript_11418:214-1065(+)